MENAPHPGPNLKFFTTHTGAPMIYTPPHVIVKEKDSSPWCRTPGRANEEALW